PPPPTPPPTREKPAPSALVEPLSPTMTQHLYLPIFPMSPGLAGIPNGGFENGPSDWITASVRQRPLIVNATLGLTPHSGDWLAWLGGADGETASLSQTLTIPTAAP